MTERKSGGLGRGIAALIASEPPPPPKRPVDDVFFPEHDTKSSSEEEKLQQSWQKAATSGRLGLRPEKLRTNEPASSGESKLNPVPGARFAQLPIGSIYPNAKQPRREFDDHDLAELVESIREVGVLQPVVVRPDRQSPALYELIMGERRWRASKAAGLTTIPVIVRETDDSEMLRAALLENLHRADLNPIEEASAYRQLLDDFGCTQAELSAKIARSRPQISNTLRLLKLPPLVQRRVANGAISAGHARALVALESQEEIENLAQRIVSEGLSVRAVEDLVAHHNGTERKPTIRRMTSADPVTEDLANRLSTRFGTTVGVRFGKNVGRVVVEFRNVHDLNRILAVMAPEEPGLPDDAQFSGSENEAEANG